jgi:glucosyl-3-phosphoglycerate synthase
MSDFFQTGAIATLHRLGKQDVKRLERELSEFARETPIALVLPCHIKELGTKALKLIVRELRGVQYLKQIVIGLDHANSREWKKARRFFAQLPLKPMIVWLDGPRMQRLFHQLEEADLNIGQPGKGRNVWTCFGCVLASEQARMVAVHDCDILTYSRELLARLCYPVAHPSLGFDFCKGYYARYADQLNGRVMRLLMTPLIRSLKSIIGAHHPYLVYMDTFRYPLAGEFSLDLDLVRRNRIPSDWGLEVGLLADVFRNSAAKAICQSELCENYDHKHQELSPRDADKGLNKMAVDISKSIFRTMAAEGIKLDTGLFDTLLSAYVRQAEDALRQYAVDAAINGILFERHEEEVAVTTFVRCIRAAALAFLDDPLGAPLIPNWNRVQSALPKFLDELDSVVQLDNAE